jgi:hypothetical protein
MAACRSCLPTPVYNFNTTGMSGLVCGISAPPAVKNISSCCPTGHWMVKSNCTQYCTVDDQAEFSSCINQDHDAAGNSSSTLGFYDVLCKDASASGNANGTAGTNGSYGGGVEGKFPSRIVGIAVRSNFVCVRLANLGRFFLGYTSQASRSNAWGYSILFLALSTIAFSVAPD